MNAPRTTLTMSGDEKNRLLIALGPGFALGQVSRIPAEHRIEIELKKRAPVTPAARRNDRVPVAIDPKHNILLLENDQVRVFRSWREAGATEKMHEHTGAGRVAVLLTDLDANVRVADGSASPVKASFGDVLWSGTVTHAMTNLSSKKFAMVVVEVKQR